MTGLFVLLYCASLVALTYALARGGMWLEPRLFARFPALSRPWVRCLVWLVVTLGITVPLAVLAQRDESAVVRTLASPVAFAGLLVGCWMSVRGFSRGWAALALPGIFLVYVWVGSLYRYVAYEEGWVEQSGDSGNWAFFGAIIFTPVILAIGIPAGLIAGRKTPERLPV